MKEKKKERKNKSDKDKMKMFTKVIICFVKYQKKEK